MLFLFLLSKEMLSVMCSFQAHQVSSAASMVLLIARVLASGRISPSLFNQERYFFSRICMRVHTIALRKE